MGFEDAKLKEAVKDAEEAAPFTGVSAAWLARRGYGMMTMGFIVVCITAIAQVEHSMSGRSDCDGIVEVYIWMSFGLALFCVVGELGLWVVDRPAGRITSRNLLYQCAHCAVSSC